MSAIKIKAYQKEILQEISQSYKHNSPVRGRIICLPMGYGKTFMSLLFMVKTYEFNKDQGIFLLVCSKTLLGNWVSELEKFKFKKIKYEIYHSSYVSDMKEWKPKDDTNLILTTPEVIISSYKKENIESKFIIRKSDITRDYKDYNIDYYKPVNYPLGKATEGPGLFHSMAFNIIFVDEFHNYNSLKAERTKAIASLYSKDYWYLSGTPFQEVNYERILGTLLFLHHENYRDISTVKAIIKAGMLTGFNQWSIVRTDRTPPGEKMPELVTIVEEFDLDDNENQVYEILQAIITVLFNDYQLIAKEDSGEFIATPVAVYILTMITYLRQSLLFPQLGAKKALSKVNEYTSEEQAKNIKDIVESYDLEEWINSDEISISSRVKKLLEVIKKYPDGKIIVFCAFTEPLPHIKDFVKEDSPQFIHFSINSNMSAKVRKEVVEKFNQISEPSIMFLSYQIGSEGLNLQTANVVINMDFYWNQSKEDQAVARMYRIGHKDETVYQHILVSKTALERFILEKKKDKLLLIDSVMNGGYDGRKAKSLSMNELAKVVSEGSNPNIIRAIQSISSS